MGMSPIDILEQIYAREQNPQQPVSMPNELLERIYQSENAQPQSEFSYPRFLGEQAAQGALSIADLPQVIGENMIPMETPQVLYNPQTGRYGISPITKKPRIPTEHISQRLKRYLKQQGINLESQEAHTPTQRILGKGAEFAGSMLGGTGAGTATKLIGLTKAGRFLGAPSAPTKLGKAKEAAQLAGIGGLGGLTAGTLTEAGLPEPVANITGAVTAPFIPGAARNIGFPKGLKARREAKNIRQAQDYLTRELGGKEHLEQALSEAQQYQTPSFEYAPTLAEATSHPRIKELHRAVAERPEFPRLKEQVEKGKEALQHRFKALEPEGHPEHTTQFLENQGERARDVRNLALRGIESREQAYPTGEAVRKTVKEEAGKRVEERRKVSPLYEKIEKMEKNIHPTPAISFIDEKIKKLAKNSSTRKYLEKTKSLLKKEITPHNRDLISTYKESMKLYNKKIPDQTIEIGDLGKVTRKQLQDKVTEMQSPSIGQLENAKQELGDAISTAKNAKKFQKAKILEEVQTRLIHSMEEVPEVKEAAKLYREGSIPINKIYEDPLIGKVLKTSKYGNDYKIGPSQVSTGVLKNSMKTKEGADNLVNVIGNDKKTMGTIQRYLNNDLYSSVVDSETGKVSIAKLKDWKRANPYAEKFYPEINRKTNNLNDAQRFVNKIEKTNNKILNDYYKEAASASLTGRDPDLLFARILNGKDKFREFDDLMGIINKDKTGAAKQGISNSFHNYLKNHATLANNEINVKRFDNLISKNAPIVEKLLTKDQIKSLNEIRDIAQKRYEVRTKGLGEGSRTQPLAAEAKNLFDVVGKVTEGKIAKMIAKFSGLAGADKVYSYVRNLGAEKRRLSFMDMMDRVFSNPKEAELLLSTPFKDEKSMKTFITKLKEKHEGKPYFLSPLVLGKEKEEKK